MQQYIFCEYGYYLIQNPVCNSSTHLCEYEYRCQKIQVFITSCIILFVLLGFIISITFIYLLWANSDYGPYTNIYFYKYIYIIMISGAIIIAIWNIVTLSAVK